MEGVPRSCLDYLKRGILKSGFYLLYDDDDQLYTAFGDLSIEPGSAWTLVMSWMTKYKELPYFKTKAITEDAPINEDSPNFWIYRQTFDRMIKIRKYSTHWRATCNVLQYTTTIDYQDYLRGKFSDFDIMVYAESYNCKPVEYINILGNVGGSGTTIAFWQAPANYFLHIDSSSAGCEFGPIAGPRVDYFRYYGDGLSSEFQCSQSNYTSTQWWFGGYL